MDNVVLDISDSDRSFHPEDSGLQPIGYTYRFTFSDQDKQLECLKDKAFINRCKMIHRSLLQHISKNGYFYLGKYTSGFEILNKLGEHTTAHIHIHFKSTHIKESMNRTIKRYLVDDWGQQYLGNASYSFKPKLIRDDDEFWRYPLKQSFDRTLCRGFTMEQLQYYHDVAKESYAKVCQVAQAKEDKRDKDDSIYLRVLAKCKKSQDTTKRAISRQFLKYYREETKSPNQTVITGYVYLAMLDLSIITEDELLDKWNL